MARTFKLIISIALLSLATLPYLNFAFPKLDISPQKFTVSGKSFAEYDRMVQTSRQKFREEEALKAANPKNILNDLNKARETINSNQKSLDELMKQ